MAENHPRLFFALKTRAPWPDSWPEGRVIEEEFRHDTLAFLKSTSYEELQKILPEAPKPPFPVAPCGRFVKCKLFPENAPRVVAWEVDWLEKGVLDFRANLVQWLKESGISIDNKSWHSHVTVCRKPFDPEPWMEAFHPLPLFASSLHLYESLGYSKYKSLWSFDLHRPFEEFAHTGDLAFRIYGKDLKQIYENAFTALCFEAPEMTTYFVEKDAVDSINEIVMQLNDIIHEVDRQVGCPFKAVSFHGEIFDVEPNILKWEMIVDV